MTLPTSPEHSPFSSEQTTPEFITPSDAITGEELVAAFQDQIDHRCRTSGLDPAIAVAAAAQVEALVKDMAAGEPILCFESYGGRGWQFQYGGIAVAESFARQDESNLRLVVAIRQLDYKGRLRIFEYTKTAGEFVLEHRSPQMSSTLYIAGEIAVREKLAQLGRQMSGGNDEILGCIQLLEKMRHTTLPAEYLAMSEEERFQLADEIAQFVAGRATGVDQEDAVAALAYLTGMTEPEQYRDFYDSIEEQWASLIELGQDDERVNIVGAAAGFARLREPSQIFGDVVDYKRMDRDLLHHSKMADIYERRAAQEHAAGSPFLLAELPEVIAELPLEQRSLAIFNNNLPSIEAIADDVRYLRRLRAAGCHIDEMIERTENKMYYGMRQLVEYVLSDIDQTSRLEAFDAMEVLFALEREPQRDELYKLLCKRFAISIPLEGRLPIRGHLGVAEAIGALMPNPPCAPDGTVYEGPARTAAIMAIMYRNRAKQLLMKYQPTQENEEG